MVVSTETHNWSKCSDYVNVKYSPKWAIYLMLPYPQMLRDIKREWKTVGAEVGEDVKK